MDGELRRPRRLTLSSSGRRASLSTMLASTTRPLATPTIAHHSFVVSTPNLQAAGSPTSSQQRPTFLQVAQVRLTLEKSVTKKGGNEYCQFWSLTAFPNLRSTDPWGSPSMSLRIYEIISM